MMSVHLKESEIEDSGSQCQTLTMIGQRRQLFWVEGIVWRADRIKEIDQLLYVGSIISKDKHRTDQLKLAEDEAPPKQFFPYDHLQPV